GAWILGGGQRTGAGRGRLRVQRVLVVVQVAVSVVLLVGAALLTRTFVRLADVPTGLETREVLSVSVPLLTTSQLLGGPPVYAAAWARYESMREELAALPGVRGAGLGSIAPLAASTIRFDLKVEGTADPTDGVRPRAEFRTAGPEYFRAAGIPLVAGRGFADTDRFGSAPVVVINQYLAAQLFPGGDALGRRIAWTGDVLRFTPISAEWRTVVGIVGTIQDGGPGAAPAGVVYHPFAQEVPIGGTLVVSTDSNVKALIPVVTRIVRRLAPTAPLEGLQTITQFREASLAPRRLNAVLLAAFGLVAVLVAAVGIGGVLAFSVRARTAEIGIRMSLGADAGRVTRMILGEGARLVILGLVLGLAGASFASALLRGLLWGVAPNDPLALLGVAFAMGVIGLAACWLPAARAARIDPAITMRAL
ncbi:MAG TPA: FtsX-like permease family protein, partial [Gemmatimonadales bacterium]|nr:FtsX-like permease family protein [Gemmatimonadales bacterium]